MNEPFGWIWIFLGVLSGMMLGTGFLREEFLGGYASPRRRLLRLGHISFIGLGALNILFAHSALPRETVTVHAASIAFIVAAISMPLTCGLVAWRRVMFPLFAVPVASALMATGLTAWELIS